MENWTLSAKKTYRTGNIIIIARIHFTIIEIKIPSFFLCLPHYFFLQRSSKSGNFVGECGYRYMQGFLRI